MNDLHTNKILNHVSTSDLSFQIIKYNEYMCRKEERRELLWVKQTMFHLIWVFQKKSKKTWFIFVFNHVVYDCIWLIMMYIIEKHCIKWFSPLISHENIQKTSKYEEIPSKKYGQKKVDTILF